jgi:hypothetical protein
MKYAIILPGNLSSFFVSLDTFSKLCETYDVDIYILYSKNINYLHTFNNNSQLEITETDIELIKNKIKNIKYFESIENTEDYNNILNDEVMKFKNKILWTKNLDLQHSFRYCDFVDNIRTKKYLDQFVRMNYLYKQIQRSNIDYDYIIRARIDQYIDWNIFENLFIAIKDVPIYPIISSFMDNFFIVGKGYYDFFDFIISNIGDNNLNYFYNGNDNKNKNKYILGPEVQYLALQHTFFKEKETKSINSIGINIEIAFAIYDNEYIYFYSSKKVNGICFGEYIGKNNINATNYSTKLENDINFKIIKNDIKYKLNYTPIFFYTILLSNFV